MATEAQLRILAEILENSRDHDEIKLVIDAESQSININIRNLDSEWLMALLDCSSTEE